MQGDIKKLSRYGLHSLVAIELVAVVSVYFAQARPPAQAALTFCGGFSPYATHIINNSPVMGPGEVPDSAGSVLGFPGEDSADFDNLGGQPGFVTVGFDPNVKITGRFEVHVEDHSPVGSDGHTPEFEPYSVFASDGVSTVFISSRFPSGGIGENQVHTFDITGKLAFATSITVQNNTVRFDTPYEGVEVLGFVIIDGTNCPEPTPTATPTSTPTATITPTPTVTVTPTPTVTPLPECSDGIDNDGDGKIDSADPGCHTDSNPNNPGSFNPNDNNEADVIVTGTGQIVVTVNTNDTTNNSNTNNNSNSNSNDNSSNNSSTNNVNVKTGDVTKTVSQAPGPRIAGTRIVSAISVPVTAPTGPTFWPLAASPLSIIIGSLNLRRLFRKK